VNYDSDESKCDSTTDIPYPYTYGPDDDDTDAEAMAPTANSYVPLFPSLATQI
jgi:hypothetical protein